MTDWFSEGTNTPSKAIEAYLVSPRNLKDFLFSGVTKKKCEDEQGMIIAHLQQVVKEVQKHMGSTERWHLDTPLWRNMNIAVKGVTFNQTQWADRGINKLGDMRGGDKIRLFQDLMETNGLTTQTMFFYYRLRSVFQEYRIPWSSLKPHPIVQLLTKIPKRIVSFLYNKLSTAQEVEITGMRKWDREATLMEREVEWETVWRNVRGASKNPNHQFIHLKHAHRAYITPQRRHRMGLSTHPECEMCDCQTVGTYMHMMWECPEVFEFWSSAVGIISRLTGVTFPVDPILHLLCDDSRMLFSAGVRKIWLAGLTAAKIMVAQRWMTPHTLPIKKWLNHLLDLLYMELSAARSNRAKAQTLQLWRGSIGKVERLLEKE